MKKLVVLTGAGISAESGFSTFRDNNGYWDKYPVERVASTQGWAADPDYVNAFYNMMRRQLIDAKPNRGHEILAELQEDFDVSVITQNVDDLHERAGSRNVIHLHGELMRTCSSRDVEDPRYWRTMTPDCLEVGPGELCDDGSLRRPYIVFFGEQVPKLQQAAEEVMRADAFAVVGSSLVVYPAAGLVAYVRRGVPIYVIDPKPVSIPTDHPVHLIQDVASRGMAELAHRLREGNVAAQRSGAHSERV